MSNDHVARIVKECNIKLPGAIDSAIRFEMFGALDELLRDSEVWKEDATVETRAGEDTYYLTVVEGMIIRLFSLKTANDTPVKATMEVPGDLVLLETPLVEEVLTANVVLTITDPTTTDGDPSAPEWIFALYRPAIVAGTLFRMMLQPAKPYSSTELASYHGRKFRNFIAQARRSAMHKNLSGAQRWQFPRFAK